MVGTSFDRVFGGNRSRTDKTLFVLIGEKDLGRAAEGSGRSASHEILHFDLDDGCPVNDYVWRGRTIDWE